MFSGEDQSRADIIVVMPSAKPRGGAELSLLHLLRHDRSVNWHVVFLEQGSLVQIVTDLGLHTVVIEAGRFRNLWGAARTVRAIARLIRSVNARAVLGWMTKSHLYGGPAAWLEGVPAIWFQKGLPSSRAKMEWIAARIPAAGILTCSSFVADAQQRLTPAVPIRPIHSAVELPNFDPGTLPSMQSARAVARLPMKGPLIGIFGRLQRWKGMHTAIAAMPEIMANHPDAKLVIAGGAWALEPDYEPSLKKLVEQLKLDDHVIFAGHLPTESIPIWMQACDVIVHASDREPFGIVLLEAMCLGKAVVAGNKGGPLEIISDGVDGLLTAFEDSVALARAVDRYLEDPEFAAGIGRQARVRAQQFSAERFSNRVATEVTALAGITTGMHQPNEQPTAEMALGPVH